MMTNGGRNGNNLQVMLNVAGVGLSALAVWLTFSNANGAEQRDILNRLCRIEATLHIGVCNQ